MPTFRTGGGFALTQRSPRARATHDNLPPPPQMGQPKFLSDLLLRAHAEAAGQHASAQYEALHQPAHQPPSQHRRRAAPHADDTHSALGPPRSSLKQPKGASTVVALELPPSAALEHTLCLRLIA